MKHLILFVLLSIFSLHALALNFVSDYILVDSINSDTTSTKSKLDRFNKKMERIVKYWPLPMASYSSETDWLIGLTKINSFRMGTHDQNDTTIQPSEVTALAYFTLNKQYKVLATSNLMFGQNKYESYTQVGFVDFPNFYYGVGNNTQFNDECLVEVEHILFEQSLGYKINKRWYIGIKYHYVNYLKVDTLVKGDEHCNQEIVEGLDKNEGVQSGLGVKVSRETRDNRFNARKGSYLYLEYMNYGKWIGSKFNYHSLILDYRKFLTPLKWLTIAGQFYAEAKFGDIPVQSLSLMGGDNRMRGIYIGRFRDKTMIEGQVEARFPIYWIFGGTVFTSLGEVAPQLSSYTLQGIKWTYGFGLRLSVNEATRSNIRFDIGFFENKPLFFFTFSEAF